jgi:hypothetical protein
MRNSFKATVRKLVELPWQDLRDLFTWPSSSTIQTENPNLLIAKAANERGEVVAYVTAEPILLAQQSGVSRMWVVIPTEAPIMDGEKFIRILERKECQPVTTAKRVAYNNHHSSVGLLN